MQQFRRPPRFDEIEEAVATSPTATTDPNPTIAEVLPEPPQETTTEPIPAPFQTTGHLPLILLSGSRPTADTHKLTAFVKRPVATAKLPALASTLQAAERTTGTTTRLVIIRSEQKRKPGSRRRLKPGFRQTIVLTAMLIFFIGTLATLSPLADNQAGAFFSGLGSWIRSAQADWQFQAHLGDVDISPTSLNGAGLPYMQIPNSPYVHVAELDAVAAGIPPVYFVRQINQESGFNPNAVSVTDAEGIAQFEPYTASSLGINPWDPYQALRGAAQLMASYYHRYGDYAKALGAYNAGPGAVQGATYACGSNWLSCMPGQSQDYVYRIMGE